MVSVELKNIVKTFSGTVAVDNVSLRLEKGEMFFLLGPSGCGKTTCLRMIAGFEEPDSGTLEFDGRDMCSIPPHNRNVGMVFQTYALFPHMTVYQNIEFGLRFRKVSSTERKNRVEEILERTRIQGLGSRTPAQLSGGQQQRVALARALVIQPDVLLLDEPLSNLDTRLRVEVREEIRRIHDEFRITSLYVTHDQDEALSLADRLAVMKDGRIEQMDVPRQVYLRPVNEFVARFVGETNILPAKKIEKDEGTFIETPAGTTGPFDAEEVSGTVTSVSVRPENVRLVEKGGSDINARVESVAFFGSTAKVELSLADGMRINATVVGVGADWKKGMEAGVKLEAEGVVILK